MGRGREAMISPRKHVAAFVDGNCCLFFSFLGTRSNYGWWVARLGEDVWQDLAADGQPLAFAYVASRF